MCFKQQHFILMPSVAVLVAVVGLRAVISASSPLSDEHMRIVVEQQVSLYYDNQCS